MEYKDFAINFAKTAGEIIKKNFTIGMKREWKSDASPVTETDTSINRLLIEEVNKQFPKHDVLGEEEKSLKNNSKHLWVCDPVDGTIPFSNGIPICTFSLALVEDGIPILGVILDPFMDRLFYAEKDRGALLNGESIKVSKQNKLFQSSVNYESFKRAKYDLGGLPKALEDMEVKATKFCAVIYSGVLIAAGEYVGDIFPHTTAHDAAALKIIVEEAGGKVTDIFGNDQRYDSEINGFIASNGLVHDELVDLTKKFVKQREAKK